MTGTPIRRGQSAPLPPPATGGGTATGTNTGDETKASIDAKLVLPADGTKFYSGLGTWLVPAGGGGGVTTFNTRSGAVTLTSGDVTGALAYTPTSVTGLTGVQSVAAFKAGIALAKGDVGLGNVDNTADAAKNVLTATKLLAARNINGVAFDGTGNITINAVDSTARLASSAVSAFGLTLIDDADAPTARGTLGLGTLATQSGTFSGTSSGTNTGDQTTITGNAGSATILQTARTINGVSFNGSANITINAVDSTARVPDTRTISTTAPLTGGGDLSANRTLAISAATTAAAGSMSAADKTKLDGIATGATANTGTVTSVSVTTANGVSGSVATAASTPAITLTLGAITPSSVAATGAVRSSSATGGVGYATGAGASVTQLTSKSTGVTINTLAGRIITSTAALAAGGLVFFTVTNSTVADTDTINLTLKGGQATNGAYRYWVDVVSAGSFVIAFENRTAGTLTDPLNFNFAVIKSVIT